MPPKKQSRVYPEWEGGGGVRNYSPSDFQKKERNSGYTSYSYVIL